MTRTVLVRASAAEDLKGAQTWYETEQAGLGARFRTSVGRLLLHLAEYPESAQVAHRGVRRANVPRFPYSLYYLVGAEAIEVIACVHMSRHPGAWRSKFEKPAPEDQP